MSSKERLRILIICTNSDQAGAPLHVQSLVQQLRNVVDFHLIFGEPGPIACRLSETGIPTIIIPEIRSSISPIRDGRALALISGHVSVISPDIIHCHSSKAGMLGRIIAIRHRLPWVYTVHGWGWRGLGSGAALAVRIIERILSWHRRASYIYVAEAVRREGEQALGLRRSQGEVIYNGVPDIGPKSPPAGRLKILMPARVSAAKDHESLVRAFERLDFDSELVLCGGGTADPQFAERLKKWAPTRWEYITCMGERSDVPTLLGQSHVFALISMFEALPLSIIEAMSAGKAIIATNVGGAGELIQDDTSGVLVAREDVKGIAAAMARMADHSLRQRLGASARSKYLTSFTADMMAAKTHSLYLKVQKQWKNT